MEEEEEEEAWHNSLEIQLCRRSSDLCMHMKARSACRPKIQETITTTTLSSFSLNTIFNQSIINAEPSSKDVKIIMACVCHNFFLNWMLELCLQPHWLIQCCFFIFFSFAGQNKSRKLNFQQDPQHPTTGFCSGSVNEQNLFSYLPFHVRRRRRRRRVCIRWRKIKRGSNKITLQEIHKTGMRRDKFWDEITILPVIIK